MAKRDDGNDPDLRVRPDDDAHSLEGSNPYNPNDPNCAEQKGTQTELPRTEDCSGNPIVIDTPDGSQLINYDWNDISRVCPEGFTIRSLDELIMLILRAHFANPDNIFDPELKQYVYTQDPSTSKIQIVMNTAWTGAQVDLLPAIVVKRGQQQSERRVMGDRGEVHSGRQGIEDYVRWVKGTHKLFITSKADGETENLALEVFNLFTCLAPILFTDLPLHDFAAAGMSELGIVEELGQSFGVVIDVVYTYEYGWTIRRIAPTLGAVQPTLNTSLVTQEETNGGLRACKS